MNTTKKDLWLRLHVMEACGSSDAPTKAFADKLARKLGWTPGFGRRAIDEYKKFVYLGMVSDFNVTPSKDHRPGLA